MSTSANGMKPESMVQVSETTEKMASHSRFPWSRRRILIVMGAVLAVLAIALGVGLGVGLRNNNNDSSTSSPSSTPTSSGGSIPGVWQPKAGATWNYQLSSALNDSTANGNYNVLDIDLFDNDADMIAKVQSQGSRVICYFSAGSYEEWRDDAKDFQPSDLGAELLGWKGENWLNVSSQNVRNIMAKRLDIAVQKKCDGVDPDNVDGYNNKNGLGLTTDDAVNYIKFLTDAAHQRNLSIGLKNAGEIVNDVIDLVQFSVNEQCVEWKECATFAPFIQQGKPVFHVEYPKGDDVNDFIAVSTDARKNACDATGEEGFSTIIKNRDLDSWIETC